MVDTANTAAERSDMKPLRVGLDIGSTTVKAVVLDQEDSLERVLFSDYRRHHANVRATVAGLLEDIHTTLVEDGRGDEPVRLAITGSGGLALADSLHVPFIQEVIAETEAIDAEYPQADVIIELGGEDAKITVPAVWRSPTACTCRSSRRSSPKPRRSTPNTRRPTSSSSSAARTPRSPISSRRRSSV